MKKYPMTEALRRLMNPNNPEPAPVKNDSAPIVDMVIEDLQQRAEMGLMKYGTKLQAHNGRDALIDAYQESLDHTMYLRQAIEEKLEWPAGKLGIKLRVRNKQGHLLVKNLIQDIPAAPTSEFFDEQCTIIIEALGRHVWEVLHDSQH